MDDLMIRIAVMTPPFVVVAALMHRRFTKTPISGHESHEQWQARIRAKAAEVEAKVWAERALLAEPGSGHADSDPVPPWGSPRTASEQMAGRG